MLIKINSGLNILSRILHKLFSCLTFWRRKHSFECPVCGKKYRRHRKGNTTTGGIDICDGCAGLQEAYLFPGNYDRSVL